MTDIDDMLATQRAAAERELVPTLAVRRDRLDRLDRTLVTWADRLVAAIAEDFGGRSHTEVQITEVSMVRSAIRDARKHLRRWSRPRRAGTNLVMRPGRSFTMPQPLGVIGIMSPWNYPLQLALAPLVGVLAAGNRALLKPSELTPRFSQLLAEAMTEHFAPDEVAVVTGGPEVGAAFAALPFDHLVFTGSTQVGRLVAVAAARNLTPVTLELGGKSPAIVDPSCDVRQMAQRVAWGKFLNAGQTCIAPDYLLVPSDMVDDVVASLVDAMRELYPTFVGNPDYTSIISDRHRDRLTNLIAQARGAGARSVDIGSGARVGGDGASRQLAPQLLLDVTPDMDVMREEIFGPVLPIVAVESLDAAIDFVNARDRPLALYWFGRDRSKRRRVLTGTISGGVTINDTLLHVAQEGLPFGGVGPSGMGSYHGVHGFRQFSHDKPVFVQSRWAAARLLYPPYTARTERIVRLADRLG